MTTTMKAMFERIDERKTMHMLSYVLLGCLGLAAVLAGLFVYEGGVRLLMTIAGGVVMLASFVVAYRR